jgi:RNA polymerase sigma-70 factor (ECF subfamily)
MDLFGAFYKKHKNKLFAYLMRVTGDYYLSSDIMQESFTRYLKHYGQKTRSVSLLYTIARNVLFDNSRKQWRNTQLEEDQEDCSGNQEHACMVREEYRQVLSAIQRLKKNEKDILALVVSGDLSYREIASVVGISEANVKVKVHRARLTLKKILYTGEVYDELYDQHVHR